MIASKTSGMRPATRHRTALVIEDDETLRDALTGLLEDEGFEVMTASTITRASYILFESRHPVGVVVIDLGMPDGDGAHLVERLYERDGKSPPVVLVSAMRERVRDLAARYGLPHLSKPVDLNLVATTVNVAFENDIRPHRRIVG